MDEVSKDARIGMVLQDRYRIVERIATGAMGSIYRAARMKLGRQVAIKFLDVSFSAEKKELVQRFDREARAMSRLGHPHCVSVIDFGVADTPYIVMEYVTGTTLDELIGRGRIPAPRAIRIIKQVLAGLAHAHGQDIIHRDMKPGNIMLTEATGTGDHARILDFGLAKLLDCARHDISTAKVVLGTPSYMSPEQSRGKQVNARTDVYSVGVVLFELLTGKKPFESENKLETLRMHQEKPVPNLDSVARGVEFSDELQEVVVHALAKKPSQRFASAMEFADALEDVPEAAEGVRLIPEEAPDTEIIEDISGPKEVRRSMVALPALLLFLAAGGAGAWYAWREFKRESPSVAKKTTPRRSPGKPATHSRPRPDASLPDAAAPDASAGPADAGVPDAALVNASTPPDAAPAAQADAAPPKPRPVHSLGDVKALIAEGRREEAIQGLRKLARKRPKSAYIPYLLGNLYFEKLWITPAIGSYQKAIKLDRNYRKKSTINKNAIRALGSTKAGKKAVSLILHSIGKAALPYLKKAAKHDRNRTVRRRANWLIKQLSKKKKKRGR